MKTIAIFGAILLAMPLALAHHNEDHGAKGTVPSMPDASIFGLCNAWMHNENGREHGNAGNAGPFTWLQQQAEEDDQTVEEWCAANAPGSPP